ncbi:hypothetical protein B2J89_15670 [Acidovorax sp. SRB_24]|nr:hypothetical protein [Acidovorax sp. SRB_24]
MDFNSHPFLRMNNGRQVCEAVLAAEAAGYDAFALGCFFDPALREARSLVDIPVVSLSETSMLTACSLGRRFAVVSLNDFQSQLTEDLAYQYGLTQRLAGIVTMAPAVSLFELETNSASVKARFLQACREAVALGAEVVIPGDGVLNAFLVREKVLHVDGVVVMDPLGVLFHHAAYFAQLRCHTGLSVSRRQFFARPPSQFLAHMRAADPAGPIHEGHFSGPLHTGKNQLE